MRIEEEIKLDYQDVLLKPKRSTLISRANVELEREFTFYHSPKVWKGIPILTDNITLCKLTGAFVLRRTVRLSRLL